MELSEEQKANIESKKQLALKRKRERELRACKYKTSNFINFDSIDEDLLGKITSEVEQAHMTESMPHSSDLNHENIQTNVSVTTSSSVSSIWDDYDEETMIGILHEVEASLKQSTNHSICTLGESTCPYCGRTLMKQNRYYVCGNKEAYCKFRQRDPFPHFVDFQISSLNVGSTTKLHCSFLIKLKKVSELEKNSEPTQVFAEICSRVCQELSVEDSELEQFLIKKQEDGLSVKIPFEFYDKVLKTFSELPNIAVRCIPKGYLLLARSVLKFNISLQGTQRSLQFVGVGRNWLSSDEEVVRFLKRVPPALLCTLYQFQLCGLAYMLRRRGRALLADEMGCGKTIQAVSLVSAYLSDGPVLVVCPASVRSMWCHELDKWLQLHRGDEERKVDIHCIGGQSDAWNDPVERVKHRSVTVTSYTMLKKLPEMALDGSWHWNLVVLDEAHEHMVGGRTPRPGSLPHLLHSLVAHNTDRALIVTGTPAPTRILDAFSLVDALTNGSLLGVEGGVADWKERRANFSQHSCFSHLDSFGNGAYWNGNSHPDELHAVLRAGCMIRRTKEECVKDLPSITRSVIRLALPDLDRDFTLFDDDELELMVLRNAITLQRKRRKRRKDRNKQIKTDYREFLDEDNNDEEEYEDDQSLTPDDEYKTSQLERFELIAELSEDERLGLIKCKAAMDWLVARLELSKQTNQKFVVFAQHLVVLNTIHHYLDKQYGVGVTHRFYQGSTDECTRVTYLQEFRCTSNSCRVMLMSIQAGAVGIDLSVASEALFVELPRNIAVLRQAEARIHRKGQTLPCEVHFLVSESVGESECLKWEQLRCQGCRTSLLVDGVSSQTAEGLLVDHVVSVSTMHSSDTASTTCAMVAKTATSTAVAPVASEDEVVRPQGLQNRSAESEEFEDSGETGHSELWLGVPLKKELEALLVEAKHAKDIPLVPLPLHPYFQVNSLTCRVRIHADGSGNQPCGVSFLPESLLAVEGLTESEAASLDIPPCLSSTSGLSANEKTTRKVALDISSQILSLSPLDRNLLCRLSDVLIPDNQVPRLSDWLGERRQEEKLRILRSGMQPQKERSPTVSLSTTTTELGGATERYLSREAVLLNGMHEGIVFRKAVVLNKAGKCEMRQPWLYDGGEEDVSEGCVKATDVSGNLIEVKARHLVPLCFRCKVPMVSSSHLAWRTQRPHSLKEGVSMRTLFCGGECFRTFQQSPLPHLHQQTGASLRYAVGKEGSGLCRCCGIDCFRLVYELSAVLNLQEDGEALVTLFRTKLGLPTTSARYRSVLGSIVKPQGEEVSRGLAGRVWQADHVTEVWDGGGQALAASNCQVLCAFCHADKTSKEGSRRTEMKRTAKLVGRQQRYEAIVSELPWVKDIPWEQFGLSPIGVPKDAAGCRWRDCKYCGKDDQPFAPNTRRCIPCSRGPPNKPSSATMRVRSGDDSDHDFEMNKTRAKPKKRSRAESTCRSDSEDSVDSLEELMRGHPTKDVGGDEKGFLGEFGEDEEPKIVCQRITEPILSTNKESDQSKTHKTDLARAGQDDKTSPESTEHTTGQKNLAPRGRRQSCTDDDLFRVIDWPTTTAEPLCGRLDISSLTSD